MSSRATAIRAGVAAGAAVLLAVVIGSRISAGTATDGVTASVTGGGHYQVLNAFDTQFAFSAVQHGDGSASGRFHQRVEFDTGTVDFRGEVTCLAVDPVNRRAWIGGVIVSNDSSDPAFTTPIHQPGHDIWFRVLDNDPDSDEPDRSTFVGFESAAIPSSEAYCSMRIWPDVPVMNARTWPVTSGNLVVHP
jgi:hypothetical protein